MKWLILFLLSFQAQAEVNIIFDFNPVRALRDDDRLELFKERFDFFDRIPEMRNVAGAIPIQATVETLAGMGRVKNRLDSLDQRGAITIIGVWRRVIDENGVESMQQHPNFPFDFAAYKAHLRSIPVFDLNGVQTGTRRPTDAEARATQINLFLGMPERELQ